MVTGWDTGLKGQGWLKELPGKEFREWSLSVGSRAIRWTVGNLYLWIWGECIRWGLRAIQVLELWPLVFSTQTDVSTASTMSKGSILRNSSVKRAHLVRSHQRLNMGEGKTRGLGLDAGIFSLVWKSLRGHAIYIAGRLRSAIGMEA